MNTEVKIDCEENVFPICQMVDYVQTEPIFISVKLKAGATTINYFLTSEEECIAFRNSVVKACLGLQARLQRLREEEEDEKS